MTGMRGTRGKRHRPLCDLRFLGKLPSEIGQRWRVFTVAFCAEREKKKKRKEEEEEEEAEEKNV